MDFYAGSQPRSFISFHLGEVSNGQPTQLTEERMEITQDDMDVTEQANNQTEDVIEVYEVTVSSPVREKTVKGVPGANNTTPKLQSSPQVEKQTDTSSLLSEINRRGGFAFSNSGSDESVNAYCVCKACL